MVYVIPLILLERNKNKFISKYLNKFNTHSYFRLKPYLFTLIFFNIKHFI